MALQDILDEFIRGPESPRDRESRSGDAPTAPDDAVEDAADDSVEAKRDPEPAPATGQEAIEDLEHQLDGLEDDVESNAAKLRSIESSQEDVTERIEDVNDRIRRLLGVYDQLTEDVNPFTDDTGEFQFGLVESTDPEPTDEAATADASDGPADELSTDAADEQPSDEPDATALAESSVAGADAAGATDPASEEAGRPGGPGTDDADGPVTFEDLQASAGSDDGATAGSRARDDDITGPGTDSPADLGLDDPEASRDSQSPDSDNDPASTDPNATDEQASERPYRGPGSPMERVATPRGHPAGADACLDAPLNQSYATELLVLEWLSELVTTSGPAATLKAIDYYAEIGWIDGQVRNHLEEILSGPDLDVHVDPNDPGELTARDHAESYAYIMKLDAVEHYDGADPG